MEKIVIVNGYRTPTGKILGNLSSLTATQLGAKVIAEVVRKSGIDGDLVDEVILGNVITAGVGQSPARQATILSGLPDSVSALTINMVCASGLKAIVLAVQSIISNSADVVIAGGMESMSNAPFLLKQMRSGKKFGDSKIIDSLVHDGLWDCYNNTHMGSLCELTVDKYKISRDEQDSFAVQSHIKATQATTGGLFRDEIVPVSVGHRNENVIIDADEGIRGDTSVEKLSTLKPAFKEDGTITAGNAPGLNDGASALLVMKESSAKRLSLKPMAEIIDFGVGHLDPKWFPIAPVKAINNLLDKTKLKVSDFDLIELNEAFAAQAIAVIKELLLDEKKVNVNGGAIALGHPIGSSGARIVVTLIHALKKSNKELGLAALCLGGGGGLCMAVRAV